MVARSHAPNMLGKRGVWRSRVWLMLIERLDTTTCVCA